jgi:hypothetical protein
MPIAMEQFFTPTRRYRDIWELDRDDDDDPLYTEAELAVPLEDFLSYRWDWKDLCALASSDDVPIFLWITLHAFLVVQENANAFPFIEPHVCLAAKLQATSGQERTLMLMQDDDPAHPHGACNIFWRAITTSNMVQLSIQDCRHRPGKLPSGPILSQLLRGSPLLQVLRFRGFDFEEEHCRALATLERTDLEVELGECSLLPQDAEDTFIEWFLHNKVVTELNDCRVGSRIISALSGNNSVKRLSIICCQDELHSLIRALPGNMGIEHLTVRASHSDENWSLLFRSMSRHPSLESLWIRYPTNILGRQILSAASKTTRMQAVLEMLRHNTVIRTIDLADHFIDVEIYLNAILPRLEMNRSCFEVQRQAVKRADPCIRPQLLGRALHVVQYNPNLVFHFLLENVPAFVRTQEEEEASPVPLQNDPLIVSGQKRKAP